MLKPIFPILILVGVIVVVAVTLMANPGGPPQMEEQGPIMPNTQGPQQAATQVDSNKPSQTGSMTASEAFSLLEQQTGKDLYFVGYMSTGMGLDGKSNHFRENFE
jgi:hypothetical protein